MHNHATVKKHVIGIDKNNVYVMVESVTSIYNISSITVNLQVWVLKGTSSFFIRLLESAMFTATLNLVTRVGLS